MFLDKFLSDKVNKTKHDNAFNNNSQVSKKGSNVHAPHPRLYSKKLPWPNGEESSSLFRSNSSCVKFFEIY